MVGGGGFGSAPPDDALELKGRRRGRCGLPTLVAVLQIAEAAVTSAAAIESVRSRGDRR